MDAWSRCSPEDGRILARALGDTPETIFACQRLSRGLCPAFVLGEPARYVSAIVVALPGRLHAFSDDPRAIWTLIQPMQSWTSITVAPEYAPILARSSDREQDGRLIMKRRLSLPSQPPSFHLPILLYG